MISRPSFRESSPMLTIYLLEIKLGCDYYQFYYRQTYLEVEKQQHLQGGFFLGTPCRDHLKVKIYA